MLGASGPGERPVYSLRGMMAAVAGMALVCWALFGRTEDVAFDLLIGFGLFATFVYLAAPFFFIRLRCPRCGERRMACMAIVLFAPPLQRHYYCPSCDLLFYASLRRPWTPVAPRDVPGARNLVFFQRLARVDPLILFSAPHWAVPVEQVEEAEAETRGPRSSPEVLS